VQSGPEAIARSAKVVADGGRVEPGINAREEHIKVSGRKIRDDLVARRKDLGFGGLPGSD